MAPAAVVAAPVASAEPVSYLTSAVDAIRSASQCPPLKPDPLVQRAARMATQSTSDYISHRSAAVPFSDPMPALKTIGYTGSKGKLVSGYGSNETDAIHGLIVTGTDTIANCALTQYGVSSALDDQGFTLTAVVLAAP
ncbi:hypothetical protein [Mycolicibacterium hodleri]|uniref:hypothetical protein n=1 Tax=Mycolicibacterium hodleri TaxID=49897 RepID=UPI001375A095|nr:hypothetical protein [Mycolicibacterium hodleri]